MADSQLRFEILEMARGLLEQEYFNARELALAEYRAKLETDQPVPIPENLPKAPTVARIISLAEKLGEFVFKKETAE